MAQADLQLNAPMATPGHGHPDKWKWYDYFTFNVDHKVIGIQYLVTSFIFYLVGGFMAVLMRTELATPDSDFLNPNLYNAFLTNHGTIMIFLWIVPAAIGGFGNYLIPL
ncbi:MAG: cbb3-type cytochrome c oxidase subunit I, partial [Nodosilinea sp.]